jgi:hypothetical protein
MWILQLCSFENYLLIPFPLYFYINFGIRLLISNKKASGFWLTVHWLCRAISGELSSNCIDSCGLWTWCLYLSLLLSSGIIKSKYKSYICFVKFIPKEFMNFDAILSDTFLNISFQCSCVFEQTASTSFIPLRTEVAYVISLYLLKLSSFIQHYSMTSVLWAQP